MALAALAAENAAATARAAGGMSSRRVWSGCESSEEEFWAARARAIAASIRLLALGLAGGEGANAFHGGRRRLPR